MSAAWQKIATRYEALTLRERAIVAGAGLVAVVLAWYSLWGEPALERATRAAERGEQLSTQLASLHAQLAQEAGSPAPGVAARAELAAIEQRSAGAQALIEDYAAELISPTEMARLLERVLERRHALSLKRLANLGAEDLLPADTPGEQRLYRHRFEMELEGPYLQCLAYLEDLEALPWRLYWQAVEIDAEDYPVNRIRIEVATMSLHEDWIGV